MKACVCVWTNDKWEWSWKKWANQEKKVFINKCTEESVFVFYKIRPFISEKRPTKYANERRKKMRRREVKRTEQNRTEQNRTEQNIFRVQRRG
jgi:hypothetical protein